MKLLQGMGGGNDVPQLLAAGGLEIDAVGQTVLEQLGEAGIIIFPHHANQAGWVALIGGIKGIQQAEAALRVFLLYTA